MNNSEALSILKKELEICDKCALRSGCQQVVFGEGNPNAKIVVIGEGPGREEDKLGRPFVGRSGQLLDKIFATYGLNRLENIYIANIVKCRPPENRAPKSEERKACLPYLYKQIEIIQPQIIILLGATALQGLLGSDAKISKMRGEWIMWKNLWVLPTYHPAALLRNPKLRAFVEEDMQKVVNKYMEFVDKEECID